MAPTAVTVRPEGTHAHHPVDPRIEAGSLVTVGVVLLIVGACLRDAVGDATALAGLLIVAVAFLAIEFVARLRAELSGKVTGTSRTARVGALLTFRRWP